MIKTLLSQTNQILKSAIEAVVPHHFFPKQILLRRQTLNIEEDAGRVQHYDLRAFKRIVVLGAGKASARMAEACEGILGSRIDSGLVITKYGHARPLSRIQVLEAGHPLPDAAGLKGARAMISLLKQSRPEDLILFLTSGGCSALLPTPTPPITLKEKQGLTALLLRSGATIQEINAVRKHISQTKGGQLAKLAYPATVINLIISDVVGDPLDSIGSGPLVPDPSTFQEAWGVLDKYRLLKAGPRTIVNHLKAGIQGAGRGDPQARGRLLPHGSKFYSGPQSIRLDGRRPPRPGLRLHSPGADFPGPGRSPGTGQILRGPG